MPIERPDQPNLEDYINNRRRGMVLKKHEMLFIEGGYLAHFLKLVLDNPFITGRSCLSSLAQNYPEIFIDNKRPSYKIASLVRLGWKIFSDNPDIRLLTLPIRADIISKPLVFGTNVKLLGNNQELVSLPTYFPGSKPPHRIELKEQYDSVAKQGIIDHKNPLAVSPILFPIQMKIFSILCTSRKSIGLHPFSLSCGYHLNELHNLAEISKPRVPMVIKGMKDRLKLVDLKIIKKTRGQYANYYILGDIDNV